MNNIGDRERSYYNESVQNIKYLKNVSRQNMLDKYKANVDSYNIKVINDILYNENTKVVANFKEFLLFDDNSEFMKRFINLILDISELRRLGLNSQNYLSIMKIFQKYSLIISYYMRLSIFIKTFRRNRR
jgi:hypothetical protein